MQNPGRLRAVGAACLAFLCAVPGCMIPTYHQPQGFSSTYYKELQKVAAAPTAVSVTPASAISPAEVSSTRVGGPKDSWPEPRPFQLPEEQPSVNDSPVITRTAAWWSKIRLPLSFRPRSDAESSDDTDLDADDEPLDRSL